LGVMTWRLRMKGFVLGPLAALDNHGDDDDEDQRHDDAEDDPLPNLNVLGAEVVLDEDAVGIVLVFKGEVAGDCGSLERIRVTGEGAVDAHVRLGNEESRGFKEGLFRDGVLDATTVEMNRAIENS